MIALLPDPHSQSRESRDEVNQFCAAEGKFASIKKVSLPHFQSVKQP